MNDYKALVKALDGQYRDLLKVIERLSVWGEFPPLERHEVVEFEMLVEEHNSIVDEIQEMENYLFQGGAN